MSSYQLKRKNNIIIGILCAVVVLMTVGYAAFSSLLNIKGTSNISSNWDIEITNIRGGNPNGGDAYDISQPTFTPTTATFSTGLKTPGTNRIYEVEVTNKGTIDGIVTIASLTCGDNEAIGFTVNEYKEKAYNDSFTSLNKTADLNIENGTNDYKNIKFYLKPTEKHYLYITVEYKDVTTQPDKLDTDIKLELNYEQAGLDENGGAIPAQTYTVNYTKEDDITSIGSNEASCEITGGANTTCEITLPTIELTKEGYMPIWKDENGKEVGEPNAKYEVTKNQTLTASSKPLPAIIQRWTLSPNTDFHTTAYKESIISVEFVDNTDVPANAVESWDVSANKTKGKVMAWVVPNGTNITKHRLYIGGEGGVIANHDSANLFSGFKNIQKINFGDNFDTSNVGIMRYMFDGCSSLTTLDVSDFDTSMVTNMIGMFFGCSNLTTLDVSNFDTSKVTYMSSMFRGCNNLATLDVSNFNTSKVTDMNSMFTDCSSLTTLDVSNFDTSKVTNMRSMFYGCSNLTTLDVSNFDTSKVTDMGLMFYSCNNLTTLDVSNFNTSVVTDMRSMFYGCSNLTTLDVSNFNTSVVTDMQAIFYNCNNLITIDVSNFDTNKVTTMWGMFYGCTNLTKLNLCSFDTSSVTNMANMFYNTPKLTQIYVSDKWNVANDNKTSMFINSGSTDVIKSNNCLIDYGQSEITPESTNEEVAAISAEAFANDAIYSLRKVFA